MSAGVDYSIYTNFVDTICASNDLSNFKSNSRYTYMLEHVSKEQGQQYLYFILNFTGIALDEVRTFCSLNDSIGAPNRVDYGNYLVCSPTSLRYVFHAHLILTYLKSLNLSAYNIVEVGGGYGGLCLALHHFSPKYDIKINSYTIVDLTAPSKLQTKYLSILNPKLNVSFVDASTFGSGIETKDLFLISNYCFSEISAYAQKEYIQTLFPKVSHGFMAWNMIPLFEFGFTVKVEDEYPNTGGEYNKYVYF